MRMFEVGQTVSGIRWSAIRRVSSGSSSSDRPWSIRSAPSASRQTAITGGGLFSPWWAVRRSPAAAAARYASA